MKLTVIIRNPANFIFMQEPCTHRTVQIDLTSEQEEKLKMQKVGRNCGQDVYEEISQCFLEASHD